MARRKTGGGFGIRGIMVDPARQGERHEYYFELLELMAEWGLNTLWWHFADDEGFMLKLRSHPELATPHAFSRTEIRDLIDRAAELGIDVVPEVESLGHGRYITRLRKYRELADGPEIGFNAVCPSHPRTLPLLEEIITEVADLFPSPYFHAGLDEVDLGQCPRCRRRARGRPRWWVYAQHVKAIHKVVRGRGKEMVMWADHVERAPGMLRVLPKDVVLAHWQYRQIRPEPIRRSLKAGFRVVGCPALCRWGNMIAPNDAAYANMNDMTATLAKLRPASAVLGGVNTCWTLWRGLRDAYQPAVAFTGEMFTAGRPVDGRRVMRRFAQTRYGAGAKAGDAIWRLQQAMPTQPEVAAALFDSPTDMFSALELAGRGTLAERADSLASFTADLAEAAAGARDNRAELRALVLAGRVAGLCCGQVDALSRAVERYRRAEDLNELGAGVRMLSGPLREALKVLRAMRRNAATVARAVDREWDRTRYGDDPKKSSFTGRRYSRDALLPKLERHERFLGRLTESMTEALAAHRKGGAFPFGL